MPIFKLTRSIKVKCIDGNHVFPVIGKTYHIVAFDHRGLVRLMEDKFTAVTRDSCEWAADRFEPMLKENTYE